MRGSVNPFRILFLFLILSMVESMGFSQNVGISTLAFTPDPSSILEIRATNQGILIPRVALTGVNDAVTIPTPAISLLVYNNGLGGLPLAGYYYNAGTTFAPVWQRLATGSGSGWQVSGNSGTQSGTDFLGTTDNQALDIRTNNIIRARITTKGQIEVLNTGKSVFVGEMAGANDDLTNKGNVFIGFMAGNLNTTGQNNVAGGYLSLQNNVNAGGNTAIGSNTLFTQSYAAASAWLSDNTAVGNNALFSNQPTSSITGVRNTAIGSNSLYQNTVGADNVALGYGSLQLNTSGNMNTAAGSRALFSNTAGIDNLASGAYAAYLNKGGNYNTASGSHAMYSNVGGHDNTATGYQAMYTNGFGSQNTATGSQALWWNTGTNNTAHGYRALYGNTTGFYNTAEGAKALNSNTSGSNNTVIGYQAYYISGNGSSNTVIGSGTGYNSMGSSNIIIGMGSGSDITGNNNIILGTGLYTSTLTMSNSLNIGNLIFGTAVDGTNTTVSSGNIGIGTSTPSERFTVFNGTTTGTYTLSGWVHSSDARLKTNVQTLPNALNKVMALDGVYFNWVNYPDSHRQIGFMAQDVEKVLPEVVVKDKDGRYGMAYGNLSVLLVNAIKEQQTMISDLKSQNTDLQKVILDLKSENEMLKARLDKIEAKINK